MRVKPISCSNLQLEFYHVFIFDVLLILPLFVLLYLSSNSMKITCLSRAHNYTMKMARIGH